MNGKNVLHKIVRLQMPQEKEVDKTEDGEMDQVHRGSALQETEHDRVKWRVGKEAFLLQWSKIG